MHVPVAFTPPIEADLQLVERLVREWWRELARFAAERHRIDGRGFIHLVLSPPKCKDVQMVWETRTDRPFVHPLGLDLGGEVAAYDPACEMVILASRDFNRLDELARDARQDDGITAGVSVAEIAWRIGRAGDRLRAALAAKEYGSLGIDPPPPSRPRLPVLVAAVYRLEPGGA